MSNPTGLSNCEQEVGSDRSFGLVFAGAFVFIALWPLASAASPRYWAVFVAMLILGIALSRPALLHNLNVVWARVGIVMGHVVSPIAMAIVFFGVITPIGLAKRVLGGVALGRNKQCKSYWTQRHDGKISPESLRNQF